MEIKSIAAIAEKWERVTPLRSQDYLDGVRTTRKDWETETVAAAENYAIGVTQAIAENRFERGVAKVGTEKWRRNSIEKGGTRWGQGVRMAGPEYARGFAPYRDELEAIDLPPRGPRGDPRNIERVRVIAERLHALKLRIG
ncbi:hypothetical protein ES708_19356 [subsurface metagenome]